jgi:hypothetical protein
VIAFMVEERRRAFVAGRRVLEISTDASGGASPRAAEEYDGAWVDLASLEGVDLPGLGRRVAAALAPGAPVVCVVPGAWPLARVLRRALRGGEGPIGRARDRLEGRPPARASLSQWREAFGPEFSWRRARALGLLLAPAADDDEIVRSPGALALLGAVEHVIGTWPAFRGLGERILLEGERR